MSSPIAPNPPLAGGLSKTRLPIFDRLRGVAALIVVAYARDDCWETMSVGLVIDAICFYFSASSLLPLMSRTLFGMLTLSTLMGVRLILAVKSMDVPGWDG